MISPTRIHGNNDGALGLAVEDAFKTNGFSQAHDETPSSLPGRGASAIRHEKRTADFTPAVPDVCRTLRQAEHRVPADAPKIIKEAKEEASFMNGEGMGNTILKHDDT